MSVELPKAYEPQKYEEEIYKRWEESGFFNPDNLTGEPYTIVMPPPNANAPSHVGHALGYTIQDILVRFNRMRGKKTLWLPGSDHAGFETQVVFEKKLEKEGTSRFQMTREEFYQKCWDYVQTNKHISETAIRRLGASCDWSRNIFTLDPEIVKVVYDTFQKMYADGLIYRAGRICNWCPKHQTGLSDLETKYEERQEPFYYFKYGPFVIGTSRPETKFGDKYVVMHPADKRYAEYKHGQKIDLEWINGPITATVLKDEAVDMTFGTGVMTITPAHDAVDFDMAQRHKLEVEQVIDRRGKLLPIAGEFAGMKIVEARPKLVEKLQTKGLVDHIDDKYKHNVQMCYKCGNLIEPQIVPQWYVAMAKPLPDGRPSLRDMAMQAVDKGEVKIVTERFEKTFRHWMENIRDWPISRQIWWGIPIPVWYKRPKKLITISFIRHAQTEANAQGVGAGHSHSPLTEKGLGQLEQLKKQLGKDVSAVYSSDQERSMQTASALFARDRIKADKRLREIDFGTLTGATKEEINKHRLSGYPGGETYTQVRARVLDFLSDLVDSHSGEHVVIAGHNGTWKMLRSILRDEPITYELLVDKAPQDAVVNFVLEEVKFIGSDAPKGVGWERDQDTFDTWFSSGQWPYATMLANDAKHGTKTFENYFPTQVMETGWDILFFWIARMIMFSYYRTGKPPFQNVFLHGLVRDKERQKMSKSKGNVIDPLGVIDTYGTDALRFALIFSTSAGNDIPLAEDKIKGMKHFANKLWNIARFVLANAEIGNSKLENVLTAKTDADKEIIVKLKNAVQNVTTHLDSFRLHEAAQEIYQFTWREFADVYVEASKAQLLDEKLKENTQQILFSTLVTVLKLLHPFMPFVTEVIWSECVTGKLLLVERWPNLN